MYAFGRFLFDPANHQLLDGEKPVALAPKAFEVLLVLVQNGNRLTTKEELMQKVWPDSFVEEANLTVNISALRKLLGTTADRQQYIETVPKKGYRFLLPVTEQGREEAPNSLSTESDIAGEVAPAFTPEPISTLSSETLSPKPLGTLRARSRLGILSLILLLAVVIGIAYITYHGRDMKDTVAPPHRLAVLPFQNLRADPGNEFLGFSLADAIISKLGYVSEITVRPSYAVQKYKTQADDIRRVASELDVDDVLTGTFLREGDDLRITCQLVGIDTRSILWKGIYNLKYEKLLTVQDRVAIEVIKGLELTLVPSETARVKKEQVVSPLAYEYYLRGVDLYSRGDFPMAIKLLEKSGELAPGYALTWAHLGRAYTANASFQFGGAPEYQRAQRVFERALALQPDQIDARIYMANMFTDTGRVEKSVPLLRAALTTNPNHAEIHWELGYAYRFAGLLRESVSESEKARRLDPLVKLNSSALNAYLYLGQYDKFLNSLPGSDDSALVTFYRGFAEYYKGNQQQAAKHFGRAAELDRSLLHSQIGKALCFGIRHDEPRGLAILHELETQIKQRGVGDPEAKYKIAQSYAVLGDQASALRVLKESIAGGFFPYSYFLTDPLLNSLRSRHEFGELLAAARVRHEAFVKAFFS